MPALPFSTPGMVATRSHAVVLTATATSPHMGPNDPKLWIYLAIALVLVLAGGLFAGLTIALMGQDQTTLEVLASSGEGQQRKNAARVLKLLRGRHHLVLVTLLLSNVIVNETLPVLLDHSIGGGWAAILVSTVLIVIFGEIVPQSICVRYGLTIGARLAPLVLGLMYMLWPVVWPIAKLLDTLLGPGHGTTYKKAGLKKLVSLHQTQGTSPDDRLNQDEVTIISAVLDLKEKSVGSIMTPMSNVFIMSSDTILDQSMMTTILEAGYSRIPISSPHNERDFVGMLLVKMLIPYDPEDAVPVKAFALATLPETRPETSCLDIINFFQQGKSHMVLVSESPGEAHGAMGVVTLEDVIEELIGEEIIDESDSKIETEPTAQNQANGATQSDARPDAQPGAVDAASATTRAKPGPRPGRAWLVPRRSSLAIYKDGESGPNVKQRGPSNAAEFPKQTNINTVKIKPGIPRTIHEGADRPQGGIGEGILESAGREASDGVYSLAAGYGSLSTAPTRSPSMQGSILHAGARTTGQTNPPSSQPYPEDLPAAMPGQSPRQTGPPPMSDRPDSRDSVQSALASLEARLPPKARSGSITENLINVAGVKKLVLETTSSSDSDDKTRPVSTNSWQQMSSPSRTPRPEPGASDGGTATASSAALSETASHGDDDGEESAKRAKRRRGKRGGKKRKKGDGHGGADEQMPLLGEEEQS